MVVKVATQPPRLRFVERNPLPLPRCSTEQVAKRWQRKHLPLRTDHAYPAGEAIAASFKSGLRLFVRFGASRSEASVRRHLVFALATTRSADKGCCDKRPNTPSSWPRVTKYPVADIANRKDCELNRCSGGRQCKDRDDRGATSWDTFKQLGSANSLCTAVKSCLSLGLHAPRCQTSGPQPFLSATPGRWRAARRTKSSQLLGPPQFIELARHAVGRCNRHLARSLR